MATDKPRFSVTFDDDVFSRIEEYRCRNGISTRSKAVAQLVEIAIASVVSDIAPTKNAPSVSDEAMRIAQAYDAADTEAREMAGFALRKYIPEETKVAAS